MVQRDIGGRVDEVSHPQRRPDARSERYIVRFLFSKARNEEVYFPILSGIPTLALGSKALSTYDSVP
jgi:hypothetical protein